MDLLEGLVLCWDYHHTLVHIDPRTRPRRHIAEVLQELISLGARNFITTREPLLAASPDAPGHIEDELDRFDFLKYFEGIYGQGQVTSPGVNGKLYKPVLEGCGYDSAMAHKHLLVIGDRATGAELDLPYDFDLVFYHMGTTLEPEKHFRYLESSDPRNIVDVVRALHGPRGLCSGFEDLYHSGNIFRALDTIPTSKAELDRGLRIYLQYRPVFETSSGRLLHYVPVITHVSRKWFYSVF